MFLNRYGLFDVDALLESSATYRELKHVEPQHPDSSFPSKHSTGRSNVWNSGFGTKDMQRVGDRVVSSFQKREHPLAGKIGERLGCGAYGCVHATDKPGQVVKIDTGRTEALLAQHVLKNPEVFKNNRSIPRFHGVHRTNVTYDNRPVWAIHREDLEDLDDHHDKWDQMKGALSTALLRANINHKHDMKRAKEAGHEVDSDKILHGHMREQVGLALQNLHKEHFKGSSHEDHFRQVHKDIMHLVDNGLMPCDLHASNWGRRVNKETGKHEVVMRDVGCYHIHNPKRAA